MSGQDGPKTAAGRHQRLETVKHVAAHAFYSYLVAFFYIWVLLAMFTMHEEIALRTHGGVPFAPHGFALVNALVLGKIAMVVQDLRIGSRIKPTPLIYPIVIEAFLLAVSFIVMHVLENVVSGWMHGEALAASIPAIGGGGALGLFAAASSFFVAMLPFCACHYVARAIGTEQMRELLLGPRRK
ncbi:MAG: hypothetical protein AB7F35_26200 [Acetobacteraceae bacterium]